MKIVIFGLTISSSWGNGHAMLWRGLCRALSEQGHRVLFFERDVPYYAAHRDLAELPRNGLVLYADWDAVRRRAETELRDADVAIATSYCPDAVAASELLLDAPRAVSVFYDLDTPVTLARLAAGETVPYIGPRGLGDFDLVLSCTGAGALTALQHKLGARRVAPLYGHVDPTVHRLLPPAEQYRADLSYLGTYAPDRQAALEALFTTPARRLPERRFVIGGAQYPADFPWAPNVFFVRHMPPRKHARFLSSSRLTLNVTRSAMARMGWCPSARLFEAAACGTPVLTDPWPGLDAFFRPGEEILVAHRSSAACAAIETEDRVLRRIAAAARERVLAEHTSERRAAELLGAIEVARSSPASLARAVGA